jgi:hypothetical protein
VRGNRQEGKPMRRIILASVPASTTLAAALDRIPPETRALVVERPDGRSVVVTAGEIMEAMNSALDSGLDPKGVRVDKVFPPNKTPYAVPMALPSNFSLKLDKGLATQSLDLSSEEQDMTPAERSHFAPIFKDGAQTYVVQHLGPDWAVVVTAKESDGLALTASLTICTCVGDPKHRFEPSQLVVPGKCNKPHGVQVNCKP